MLKIGYSETYHTDKGVYRYNYTTRQLEHLENRIQLQTVHESKIPVVQNCVTDKINLKPERFDQCPQYWVELYESVLERTIKRGGPFTEE